MNNESDLLKLEIEYHQLIRQADDIYHKAEGIKYAIDVLRGKNGSNLNGNSNNNHPMIASKGDWSDYDVNWPNKAKVHYILKREQRFLHVRQIAEMLMTKEPSIPFAEWKSIAGNGLAGLKKEGKVKNIRIDNNFANTFWGSDKWLDENGDVKSGHEFDRSYLREEMNENTYDI